MKGGKIAFKLIHLFICIEMQNFVNSDFTEFLLIIWFQFSDNRQFAISRTKFLLLDSLRFLVRNFYYYETCIITRFY
uniref:Uncharacterized protein n=1 Tax=Strigamia maritima TaxID=126957 RepID=T1JGL8_STRMM